MELAPVTIGCWLTWWGALNGGLATDPVNNAPWWGGGGVPGPTTPSRAPQFATWGNEIYWNQMRNVNDS